MKPPPNEDRAELRTDLEPTLNVSSEDEYDGVSDPAEVPPEGPTSQVCAVQGYLARLILG